MIRDDYIKRAAGPQRVDNDENSHGQASHQNKSGDSCIKLGEPNGRINSTARGFSGGRLSSNIRKRDVHSIHTGIEHPDIIFTIRDFEGIQHHEDDPMVVMLRIVGYNVKRVLLDQGSSADLIYGDSFEQFGFTDNDLLPYDGSHLPKIINISKSAKVWNFFYLTPTLIKIFYLVIMFLYII